MQFNIDNQENFNQYQIRNVCYRPWKPVGPYEYFLLVSKNFLQYCSSGLSVFWHKLKITWAITASIKGQLPETDTSLSMKKITEESECRLDTAVEWCIWLHDTIKTNLSDSFTLINLINFTEIVYT